ncbi:MAG: hypothetical protein V7L14_22795 [Nostoc sp.]|uniref:hypothetical protein n=1 Tax=Nostoc sp. TaxID=1180 RepID=UPI002FFA374C
MDNNQKSKIFTDNIFEVIKQYKNKHNENNIYNSQEYKDFIKTVKQPFINFCHLIHQEIPCEIAANNFYILKPTGLFEVDIYMLVSTDRFRLYKYLDIFSLLYIELTDTGIDISFIELAGKFLVKKIVEINPIMIANRIAENIKAFDFPHNIYGSCYFTE